LSTLKIKNLSFGEVRDVSFSVNESECVGISGESGAGKSLLLRAIVDLDSHEGEIYFDNQNRQNFPAPEWRKLIMLVPSETAWWHEEVGDHLCKGYNKKFVFEFCEQLGFATDVLQWKTDRMSTGEKQRLGLLRALSFQPKVLLLDEPTAHLDSKNTLFVEALVESYRKRTGSSVIWIAHNQEQLLRVAKRHFLLQNRSLFPV